MIIIMTPVPGPGKVAFLFVSVIARPKLSSPKNFPGIAEMFESTWNPFRLLASSR